MKTFLTVFLISLIIISCNGQKSRVEILPDLESEYLSIKEVDVPPADIDKNPEKINNDLIEAVKNLNGFANDDSIRFPVRLELYMNEKGNIDKIKDIAEAEDRNEFGNDGVKNFTNRKKMNEAIASRLEEWSFEPAKKDKKNVKFRTELKADILGKNGEYKIELPDFINSFMVSESDYRLKVDQMPEPDGGIKTILDKIVYPASAKAEGISGRVYVQAFIDENGDVVETKIVKGVNEELNKAASDAVKATKFKPAMHEGKRVKVQIVVPINFVL